MRGLSLLGSSTFRRGVLIALLAWAPGALVLSLLHHQLEETRLVAAADRLTELEWELLELTWENELEELGHREHYFSDEDLEEDDFAHEPFADQDFFGDALDGEEDGEDSENRRFHHDELEQDDDSPLGEDADEETEMDAGEAWREALEDRLDEGPETVGELTTQQLFDALDESPLLEEPGVCLRLTDATSRVLLSSFGGPWGPFHPVGDDQMAQVVHYAVEDDDISEDGSLRAPWFLLARRTLADGGRLHFGIDLDDDWRSLRRSRRLRDLVILGGLPLALLLGFLATRPVFAFLTTLHEVATRQGRGALGSRLRTRSLDGDLAQAAETLNTTFNHLEGSLQTLSRIGDSIAHDLRTPLSRLQGQLDLLRRHPDPTGELIDAVQHEVDQLLGTFNALLRIAQIESGQKRQGFARFDLAETVADVAELYAPVFAEKGVEFSWQDPGGTVASLGDRDLWTQALSNLVENALKYTPEGGRVGLLLESRARRRKIVLRDTGPGIPELERENVFKRFYRLESHRGERGNGLGLTLVAAVCELHGATIALGDGQPGLAVEITWPHRKPQPTRP